MVTKKVEELSPKERFKRGVRAMLTARKIKNFVPMYIWMRDQKQLAVDANYRRVYKFQEEMSWLEEMVDEDEKAKVEAKIGISSTLHEIGDTVMVECEDKEIVDK